MNKRSVVLVLVAVVFPLVLAGCGAPVPEDKANYVGDWSSEEMTLSIEKSGTISYKRTKGSGSTEINGPIQSFDGDNFVVGILFLNTTFEVSKPPYEEDGVWKMVVDGVELTRAD